MNKNTAKISRKRCSSPQRNATINPHLQRQQILHAAQPVECFRNESETDGGNGVSEAYEGEWQLPHSTAGNSPGMQ